MTGHEQDVAFVIWAYGGAAVVVLGLIATVWLQSARISAKLRALEAQGVRRRSAV